MGIFWIMGIFGRSWEFLGTMGNLPCLYFTVPILKLHEALYMLSELSKLPELLELSQSSQRFCSLQRRSFFELLEWGTSFLRLQELRFASYSSQRSISLCPAFPDVGPVKCSFNIC